MAQGSSRGSAAATQRARVQQIHLVPAAPFAADHPAVDRARILHIEGVEPIRSIRKMVLEQGGFFVTSAGSIADGMFCLREFAFDVIVIDEGVLSSGGIHALASLRKQAPGVHIGCWREAGPWLI